MKCSEWSHKLFALSTMTWKSAKCMQQSELVDCYICSCDQKSCHGDEFDLFTSNVA
jgi:hypothetical protein